MLHYFELVHDKDSLQVVPSVKLDQNVTVKNKYEHNIQSVSCW